MNLFIKKNAIILLSLIILFGGKVSAQTKTFIGASNNSWGTNSNWNPNGVPKSSNPVIIPGGATCVVDINNAECASLTFSSGTSTTFSFNNDKELTVSGDVTINNSTTVGGASNGLLEVNGNLLVATGATFTKSNGNLTINGTSQINGRIVFSSNQGTKTFAGLIMVESAGRWENTGGESFYIKNNLTNNGNFITGTAGTFTFNGISSQAIGGSNSITFHNVTINNTAGVTLLKDQTINGTLTFINGKLQTGPNMVTLGTTGSVQGEERDQYLVGNLSVSRTVGSCKINNLGGTGFSILSSGNNLGTVSVTRISGSAGIVTAGGNQGIARKWIITSTNPPASGRSISFSWVSDDDNGIDLENALVFRSANGSEWSPVGIPQNVSANRTIIVITNNFSTWTVADAENPLPVELISFTASLKERNVILNWATQTEVQNYGFEIERMQDYSANGGEKPNDWKKIGFVQGKGNSNAPGEYSFTDNELLFGKYSYRLKQIGTDGSYEYSNKVDIVTSEVPYEFVLEQNYPNPFNPTTTLRFAVKETVPALLKVYDVLGREVATLVNEEKTPGVYEVEFDGREFSSGIYFYEIQAGNFREIRKMTLIK